MVKNDIDTERKRTDNSQASKRASKDYSISFVRFVATIFIIICHVQQYYNIELCWWFNVGVQMFFYISGYLYSNRVIEDSIAWNCKQFLKILVPYYICIIITCGIGFFLHAGCGIKQIFHLIVLNGTGGFITLDHTWFISYILLCYMITPALLNMKIICRNNIRFVFRMLFLLCGMFIFFELYAKYYKSAWIICYTLGIIFGQFETYHSKKTNRQLKIFIVFIAAITNLIAIYFNYFSDELFYGFSRFFNYPHVFLGIALVIIFKRLYKTIQFKERYNKILDLSDKYSFYIYLTHQIFILGEFSLLGVVDNLLLGLIAVIICTFVSAYILYLLSSLISPIVNRFITKLLFE